MTDKDVKFQVSHNAKAMCTKKREKLCNSFTSSDVIFQMTPGEANTLRLF